MVVHGYWKWLQCTFINVKQAQVRAAGVVTTELQYQSIIHTDFYPIY